MRYFWCELAIVSAFMITFAVEFNSLTIINIRTMVNYKDLGLVNTRDMFAKADRKSTRLNSSHKVQSRMPSSA